jgi:hypothetical protein
VLAACVSTEYAPHSEPIEVGESVEQIVATDCGLDNMVFDIDGSLWVPTVITEGDREGVPAGFEPDNDTGRLTLVSEDEAEHRSSQGRVVTLRRLSGNLVVRDCLPAPPD